MRWRSRKSQMGRRQFDKEWHPKTRYQRWLHLVQFLEWLDPRSHLKDSIYASWNLFFDSIPLQIEGVPVNGPVQTFVPLTRSIVPRKFKSSTARWQSRLWTNIKLARCKMLAAIPMFPQPGIATTPLGLDPVCGRRMARIRSENGSGLISRIF